MTLLILHKVSVHIVGVMVIVFCNIWPGGLTVIVFGTYGVTVIVFGTYGLG